MSDSTLVPRSQRMAAEFVGTAFLLIAIVGSGIMGETLAHGNEALTLLANTLATGAILFVLIAMFAPASGAHFNPAVTLAFVVRRELGVGDAIGYLGVQLAGAVLGVWLTHAMFGDQIVQFATKPRSGFGQWLAEGIATFGLVMTILGTRRWGVIPVAASVGLFIFAACWFTASTSFANPAVTVARVFSDTFSGIRAVDAPPFVAAQLLGAIAAVVAARWLVREK